MQLGGIAIDAKCAGARELILAITAAEQSDAQHSGAAGGEKIPDCIADDVAIVGVDTEALLAVEKKIGRRLRSLHVAALDDDRFRSDAEDGEGAIDLGTSS